MNRFFGLLAAGVLLTASLADAHYDIAPYLENGQLLTGGLDHAGNAVPPVVSVYGYDFGEDAFDPFNPSDPGVNQTAGVGNLPAGAALRYNILSSLLYWDGSGGVSLAAPPGDTHISLLMGTTTRTLTGTSGTQSGSLIQSVLSDGSVHKHFTTSLHADATSSNVPGDGGYVAPTNGVYAFSMELTMTVGSTVYSSNPLWVVFNNGLDEEVHDAAIDWVNANLVPEPMGMTALAIVGWMLTQRKR